MPNEITGEACTQVSTNMSWRNHGNNTLKKKAQ